MVGTLVSAAGDGISVTTAGSSIISQVSDLGGQGALVIAATLPIGMGFWAVNYFKNKGKQTAK